MANTLLDKYEIRRIGKDGFTSEIRDFIIEFYTKGDVLAKISDSTLEDEDGIYAFRAQVAIEHHDASFAAYEKSTGKLVGVKVSFVHRKGTSSTPTSMINDGYSEKSLSEKAKMVIRFVDNFFGDVFTELGTDRYLELGMACVHRDHVRQGLAGYLSKLSSVRCKELGCDYAVAFCTSLYTQKAMVKNGLTLMREWVYADYVDPESGKKPFKAIPEQTHAKLYYKKM